MEELLEKIPPEKRWAITAKVLTGFLILRGVKSVAPLLGMGEGIFAPAMGWEKYEEINTKVYAEGGKKFFPWVKEMFNMPVEDAVGAAKLVFVAATLLQGPEYKFELIESKTKRIILRGTQCAFWKRYKDKEVDPGLTICHAGDQAWCEEGLKAINPKLIYKLTSSTPRGDPYCEAVIEFKEE